MNITAKTLGTALATLELALDVMKNPADSDVSIARAKCEFVAEKISQAIELIKSEIWIEQ